MIFCVCASACSPGVEGAACAVCTRDSSPSMHPHEGVYPVPGREWAHSVFNCMQFPNVPGSDLIGVFWTRLGAIGTSLRFCERRVRVQEEESTRALSTRQPSARARKATHRQGVCASACAW